MTATPGEQLVLLGTVGVVLRVLPVHRPAVPEEERREPGLHSVQGRQREFGLQAFPHGFIEMYRAPYPVRPM